MTLENYLALRNGSDVRGVACEGIVGEDVTLTTEAAENIAKAFCVWLISHTGKTKVCVAVGHDPRITSPALCEAAVRGITSTGHDAVLTGLSTTPSMFAILKDETAMAERYCHGSIMITASHLPFNRNGLKFFSHECALESADVKDILEMAATFRFAEPTYFGQTYESSYLDTYAAGLVEKVRTATGVAQPLLGKKIVVDAGNGSGGFFVDKVLKPLGADTTGSILLDPDGNFPCHTPNPESETAMSYICDAVKRNNAEFGIIFDTDVDRAGAVDENGEPLNRNRLIALISAILLREQPGSIVTDSVTSDGLRQFISARGGKQVRFKRGYKNVINEAIRLNEKGEYAPLAIETSGHAALKENYFLDDGAYLIVRLLIAMAQEAQKGKKLADLIKDLPMPVETAELRVKFVNGVDFKVLGKKLIEDFTAYGNTLYYAKPAEDNFEGFRLCYDDMHGDGWVLMRMSLHDPVLPINLESNSHNGCIKIAKDLYYFLRKYDFLDLAPITEYIDAWRSKKTDEVRRVLAQQ